MPLGYQLWVLFEGWGLKETGLRLSDRGSRAFFIESVLCFIGYNVRSD